MPGPQLLPCLLTAAGLLALGCFASGCANPGPPRPPSLQLPAAATDLHAERVGRDVHLTWTTSNETTDDLPARLPLTAELCRDPAGPPKSAACTPIARFPVHPGPSSTTDSLPAGLLADPIRPLVYRVRLLNARGRSAEPSNLALSAAGAAPSPVTELSSSPTDGGLRLQWQAEATSATAVILLRTLVALPSSVPAPSAARAASEPTTVRLLAAQQGNDLGGTLDLSALRTARYTYVAWRERSASLNGQTFVLRSIPSASLAVQVRDLTPPQAPTGLEAVAYGSAADLSWDPNREADLAGYIVERTAAPLAAEPLPAAAWKRLTIAPLPSPAFHDILSPVPARYLYRVSAVDTSGNLSKPSASSLVEVRAAPASP